MSAGIIADTHVHLYSEHDTDRCLRSIFAGLCRLAARNAPAAHLVAFLTEREGSHAYRELRDAGRTPGGIPVEPGGNEHVLRVCMDDERPLLLYAGRQIVSAERVEVLALTADLDLPDGAATREVVDAVIASGAVPVLPWSPGKWMGARGEIVRVLVGAYAEKLCVGDLTIRSEWLAEPGAMKLARDVGCSVLCGSDPLPFRGEEGRMARYGTRVSDVDPHDLGALRAALRDPEATANVGTRDSTTTMGLRMMNMYAKKFGLRA